MLTHFEREKRIWCSALPTNQKILILAFNHFADANGECWPGQARLANMCGFTDRTVRTTCIKLEQSGIIQRSHRYKKGGRTSDLYRINFDKIPTGTDFHNKPLPEAVSASLPEAVSASLPEAVSASLPEAVSDDLISSDLINKDQISVYKRGTHTHDDRETTEALDLKSEAEDKNLDSPLLNKDPELKGQTREQPLLDQKERKSSAKKKESGGGKIAPIAGENRGWSESRLREVWDGSRGKNAKAMGLCAITYGVQHGLDKFLEYAQGDREQAYKFLRMAIAAQFRDDFYRDKPMRFEQVLSLDPSRNCPAYCGNWLGAAIEAEERKSKPAPATLISKIKSFVPNNLSGWELA